MCDSTERAGRSHSAGMAVLAAKRDLKELELKLEARLSESKSEIIKWMIGVAAARTPAAA